MLETENLGLGFPYHLLADLFPSSSYTFNSLGVLHWRWEGRKGRMENHREPLMLGKSCQIILWARCLESSCWTPTRDWAAFAPSSSLLSIQGAGEGWGTRLGVPHFTKVGSFGRWMLWTMGGRVLSSHSSLSLQKFTGNFSPSTLQERKGEVEFCWPVRLFVIIIMGEMWPSP